MDNQEQITTISRDEYIRLARESCVRNLDYHGGMKNYGGNKRLFYPKKVRSLNSSGTGDSSLDSGYAMSKAKVKFFLIRLICAFILFLTIFIIDKFEIKISTFTSKNIEEMVATNQGIQDAEAFFVKLFEQFANKEE
ncbi:MAG: hypothetical protein ACFWTJ_08790 [Lachnoclostridium sp.]|jgi:hypothetical protein